MARVELFFGLTPASKVGWSRFLAREVTPRFPDGLTVIEAQGQWRGPSGRIGREPARELLVWYVPGPESDAKIEAVRAAYKRRFHQQSVLRVDGTDCVSF